MSPETWTIIISTVAIIIGGAALFKAHQAGIPITGELITNTLQSSEATAAHYAEIAKAGVFAAEQLKVTGKLPDNNAAFQYALQFAKKMLPDLDAATLTTFIEAAVPLANQLYSALPKTSPPLIAPVSPPLPPQGRMGME